MRKLLSVLLAVVMVVSIGTSSAVVAMAATNVASIESTTKKKPNVVVDVNGQTSTDVRYEVDPTDPNKITFTYDGDGELVGWKFLPETLREGVDYKIVNQSGKSITVELLNGYNGDIIANAIVKYPEQPTVPGEEPTEPSEEPEEPEETTTGKKNPGHKSPNTGVASATGLGVAAAGAAILVALKKKDDAE